MGSMLLQTVYEKKQREWLVPHMGAGGEVLQRKLCPRVNKQGASWAFLNLA